MSVSQDHWSSGIYYCSNDDGVQRAVLSFEMWCEKRKDDNPQFAFWYMILAMELTTLSLVRAFREANFVLYCQALSALIPYFFTNNNTNYARWLPIHLRDMLTLEQRHPALHQESCQAILLSSSPNDHFLLWQ